MKFKTTIGRLKSNVYQDHILIPAKVHEKMASDDHKRVMCSVNGHEPFHAGLMPKGDGDYFILVNKKRMKAFELELGMEVQIKLEKDTSKYGMVMPEEFQEVLSSDPEGEDLFEKLTSGKQRNLIHLIAMVKSTDIRITKSLIILDHLKANEGKIDFKLLNEAMKVKNRKF